MSLDKVISKCWFQRIIFFLIIISYNISCGIKIMPAKLELLQVKTVMWHGCCTLSDLVHCDSIFMVISVCFFSGFFFFLSFAFVFSSSSLNASSESNSSSLATWKWHITLTTIQEKDHTNSRNDQNLLKQSHKKEISICLFVLYIAWNIWDSLLTIYYIFSFN